MGAVYKARDLELDRLVALKVIRPEMAAHPRVIERFKREILLASKITHKNVVRIHDLGEAGDLKFISMNFVEGISLRSLIDHEQPVPLEKTVGLLHQIAEALGAAHEAGVVHRDLKPQNILLTAPEGGVAKVSDFGLARSFEKYGYSGMTSTGSIMGTFPYMPREQVTNFKYVKPPTDVWAMGATLYNLLTGAVPRDVQKGEDPIDVILKGRIVPVEKRKIPLSSGLAAVINKAIRDDFKDRYQSAAEFRQALGKVL